MATPAVQRGSIKPKALPVSNLAKAQNGPVINTEVGNQANYRKLAESAKLPVKDANAAATSTTPATVAGGKPGLKLPPLSPRVRQEMIDDIEKIVAIMKTQYVTDAEETQINGILAKYSARDRGLRPPLGETLSPNLDHFLILMKSRAFSRSSVKSIGQDQYAILYDAIWYRFDDEGLDEFKNLVARSQTQKTSGPGDKDVENGLALIAKQEAMGMWGMLKGMGTGLVGIAGPTVSQAMAEQFDEAARELFGHEWDNSEPLVLGMNAGQIGTAGGDVIWQLVTFARSAGAKGGKILELANKLKDITDTAQKVLAVSSGLQGIYLSASGIARIIEEKQKAGKKITAEELINDGAFVDQLVTLMSSVINTTMAVKGAKVAPLTRARVQVLLGGAQIAASISHLATIAASDKTEIEKELEYGQVIAGLIPQLVSAALDTKRYADDRKAKPKPPPAKPVDEPAPRVDEQALKTDAAPRPTDDPAKVVAQPGDSGQAPLLKPQQDDATGDLARKSMTDPEQPVKRAPKFVDESPAAQKLQSQLAQEADTGLAPRQAPATPEEVKTGARKAKYEPGKRSSKTIGKPVGTLDEARAIYDDVIAETAGKYEVGIYQKPDGTYAVRLGQAADVDAPTEWRSVQHYHTNQPDIPLWRMPARADITEPYMRATRTNKPTTEIVEYPLPGGKRGRAAYTVNPDGSMKVEFVDAAGNKQSKSFASVKDYNDYYKTQTVYLDPNSEDYKRLMAGPGGPPVEEGVSTKTQEGVPAQQGPQKRQSDVASEVEETKTPRKQSQRVLNEEERIKAAAEKARLEEEIERSRQRMKSNRTPAEDNARLKELIANPKQMPADLRDEVARLPKDDPEERIEAIRALLQKPGLSTEAIAYLKWQEEIQDLRQTARDRAEANAKLGDKQTGLEERVPDAVAALRKASKSIKQLMRLVGPNYRKASKIAFDEVLKEERFNKLPPNEKALQTDHLVPLDWVANSPEMTEFLKVYASASKAEQQAMGRALIDLGDIPDNLVRMRADANNFKSAKAWKDMSLDELKKFGYDDKDYERMVKREADMLTLIKAQILALANEYRKS